MKIDMHAAQERKAFRQLEVICVRANHERQPVFPNVLFRLQRLTSFQKANRVVPAILPRQPIKDWMLPSMGRRKRHSCALARHWLDFKCAVKSEGLTPPDRRYYLKRVTIFHEKSR